MPVTQSVVEGRPEETLDHQLFQHMYVYILKCSDGSFYTGVTNNLELRIKQHHEGINRCCYTFNRRPLDLAYFEKFQTPMEAIRMEKKLKG